MTTANAVSNEQIKETVFTLLGMIAPEADFGELAPTVNIQEALDIDSFDFLNLLIGLNEEFGIEVPESDYGKLNSMNNIVAYFGERLG
ncbi:MAG: acyl carrier protein [Chloroflexi bacterium]|nr:acyl carrier protein [Chloroflexota bacterium]